MSKGIKSVSKKNERLLKSTKTSPVKSEISKSRSVRASPKNSTKKTPPKRDFGESTKDILNASDSTRKSSRIKLAKEFDFGRFITPTKKQVTSKTAEINEFKIPDLPKNWKKKGLKSKVKSK